MAGYSGTPLVKKLGISEGARLLLLNAPEGFDGALGALPTGVATADADLDVIVLFTPWRAELEAEFQRLAGLLKPNGGFWIGWPKKASKRPTDLTEDVIRAIGLTAGLVDNKVCAIDDTWSGLRFVYRLKDRPGAK